METMTKEDAEWLVSNYTCYGNILDIDLERFCKNLEEKE